MTFLDVLITCPDHASAERLARTCVEEGLAACANVGGGVTSVYRWKGAIEMTGEVVLTLKTRALLFERLSERVKALHPYELPCIVAMELARVEPAYAAWLEAETA